MLEYHHFKIPDKLTRARQCLSVAAEAINWKADDELWMKWQHLMISLVNLHDVPYNKIQLKVPSTICDFPGGSDSKASVYNTGDPGSIPGLGRSPGEGNGNPLQYSCLENPMDRGAWWATIRGVSKGWTRLSHFTSAPSMKCLDGGRGLGTPNLIKPPDLSINRK